MTKTLSYKGWTIRTNDNAFNSSLEVSWWNFDPDDACSANLGTGHGDDHSAGVQYAKRNIDAEVANE